MAPRSTPRRAPGSTAKRAAAGASPPLRVLQVSAELVPLLKTGGLADVTGALPAVLGEQGCDVRLLLPGFAAFADALVDARPVGTLRSAGGEDLAVRCGRLESVAGQPLAYVIDAPALYRRAGGPYADAADRPFADNHHRFAPLGQVAAALAGGLDAAWRPQIVHAHDWHAGLVPACLHFAQQGVGTSQALGDVRSVYTVHNLAYQGVFPAAAFADLGLPAQAYQMHGLEFHGQVSFMKAGLQFAHQITTVSPSYAREVLTAEQGCGLDGLLRQRQGVLTGILNGVDGAVWNPATDALIAQRYDASQLPRKAINKTALQVEMGLAPRPEALLLGVVSRLTEQKGLHLVLQALPELLARGGQLVVLGTGEPGLVAAFTQAARQQPDAVALFVGYDEQRSHRVFAGADVIAVPSRFEPCGLTQLYGLAYGSLPLVHRVGGLADSVVDCALENLADDSATGFVFERFTATDHSAALRRAFALHAQPEAWARVQRAAMRQRFGWDSAAQQLLAVYRAALDGAA